MVEKGSEEFLDKTAIRKFALFAEQLAQWDSRIVEIVAMKDLTGQGEEKLDLVCTFEPEPASDITGFFWIVNLLTRIEFEALDERLGINESVDMAFRIGERVFLPDGKTLNTMGEHIVIWSSYAE